MVPAGEQASTTVDELYDLLDEGDLVIEGGNTHYVDDRERADKLAGRGIGYLDVGVSGGVWGRQNGYGIMVGGAADQVERARSVFESRSEERRVGKEGRGRRGRGEATWKEGVQ